MVDAGVSELASRLRVQSGLRVGMSGRMSGRVSGWVSIVITSRIRVTCGYHFVINHWRFMVF